MKRKGKGIKVSFPNQMNKLVNIDDLHKINFDLAEELKLIRLMMVGKGISPADSPLVQSRMHEIESKLRMIGADPNNIIPFEID